MAGVQKNPPVTSLTVTPGGPVKIPREYQDRMGLFDGRMIERPGGKTGPEIAFIQRGEGVFLAVVMKDPVGDKRKIARGEIDFCRVETAG
jgi:hypothetical protein